MSTLTVQRSASPAALNAAGKPSSDLPAIRVGVFRSTIELPEQRPPLAGVPNLSSAQFAANDDGLKAMKTVSRGKERPATPGHDEAPWGRNRRAMINPR